MYGFWIKPDRFLNFQGLYAVYLNQLKNWAYRLEDFFTGKTERFHEAGVDGYIIEAATPEAITEHFTTLALPKAQFAYTIAASGTIAANLVPGSVLIASEKYNYIADNGNGVLVVVDGMKIGTIDYTTGKYVLDIKPDDLGKVVVGYAVVGTNETYKAITGTVAGTTATIKAIVDAKIPGAQVGFTGSVYTASTSRKFFVGFTTNDLISKGQILSKITGAEVTVTAD